MKKITISILLLSSLTLGACDSSSTAPEKNKKETSTTKITEKTSATKTSTSTESTSDNKKTIYNLGEWWEVPNQWKLKIDSVTSTDERNLYSDKSPQQVVIISYTYENLGYEDDIQDLFIMPENVVDSAGIMGETYPVSTTGAKPTPVGATMSGAQAAYGVQNPGGNIKILFKKYDSNRTGQAATFEIPVQ